MTKAEATLQTDLADVARRFAAQYTKLLQSEPRPEENAPLQERLRKAGQYFSQQLPRIGEAYEAVRKVLKVSSNKEILRRGNELLRNLNEELEDRQTLLDYVATHGFFPETYHHIRAKVKAGIALTRTEKAGNGSTAKRKKTE